MKIKKDNHKFSGQLFVLFMLSQLAVFSVLVCGANAQVPSSGAANSQAGGHFTANSEMCVEPFPKTGFLTFGGSTPDWLEKFDVVLSREVKKAESPIWLPMRDFNRADEFIEADYPEDWFLRRSKKFCSFGEEDLKGECSSTSQCTVCYNKDNGEIGERCATTAECPINFKCEVPETMVCTDKISLYGITESWWSNFSVFGKRYTGVVAGIPANNERLIDWYPKFLKAFVDRKNGDGISSDGLYYRLHFQFRPFADVDSDHNGKNDIEEHGNSWFIEHWTAGVDEFLANLRNLLGPDSYIVINTGSSDMHDHPMLNGLYYENTAGESNWEFTRSVYFSGRNAVDQPPIYVQGMEVDAGDDQRVRPTKNYYTYMRFGLARALMLDEYYEFQDLNSRGEHIWSKYYDEFDMNIGCPTGDMQQVKNGVWARFFEGGAAILNIKDSPSTVSNSELAALNGYDGPYFHFLGGQDRGMNDGSQFDSVVLEGHSYLGYTGEPLIAGDGVILVKTPQTVVTDIFIDNNGSGTSPGSDKAELSTAWTETCDGDDHYTIRCLAYDWLGNDKSYSTAFSSSAGASAVFRPTIGVEGDYEIFEWHGVSPNPCSNVGLEINGQARPNINQAINQGQWNSLGTFSFAQGSSGYVELTAPGGCTAIADVVKFVYAGGSGGPVISNVVSSNITMSGATITWTTDIPSDSQVDYGLTVNYGNSTPLNPNKVTNHSVNLSGLESEAAYHYRVKSKDGDGNLRMSGDKIFTTLPDPNRVIKPVMSPPGETFVNNVSVSISTATAGATIRYTTDGSDPTTGSNLYTGPVTLTATATLKARAFKAGMLDSGMAVEMYTKITNGCVQPDGLFCDDFNDGNYNGWQVVDFGAGGHGWTISDGVLHEASDAGDTILKSPYSSEITSYKLGVRARVSGIGNSYAGVVFGFDDADNYYAFIWDDPSNYYGVSNRKIIKVIGGTEQVLASDSGVWMNEGQMYDWKIEGGSGVLKVLVNGSVVLIANVTVPIKGNGMRSWDNDGGVDFDDYTVVGSDGGGLNNPPESPELIYSGKSEFELTGLLPLNYQFAQLSVGSPYYVDRNFTLTSIPASLAGSTWVKTANDDKMSTSQNLVSFISASAVSVYVNFDTRVITEPNWLRAAGWVKTGESVTTSDGTFNVFRKSFPAGQIILGGNRAPGAVWPVGESGSNYFVAVKAAL